MATPTTLRNAERVHAFGAFVRFGQRRLSSQLTTAAGVAGSVCRAVAGVVPLLFQTFLASCHEAPPVDPLAEPAAIEISIDGLPAGVPAEVVVTGPRGFFRSIADSEILASVPAGQYSIRAASVRSGGFTWSSATAQLDTVLFPADTLRWKIKYEVATGAIALSIEGLPGGVPASVRVVGNGTSRTANGSVVLADVAPGKYSILIDSVNAGGTAFTGTGPSEVSVAASTTPEMIAVQYGNVKGALRVIASVAGVNGSTGGTGSTGVTGAAARIQGPLNTDTILSFGVQNTLPVGTYTVTPLPIQVNGKHLAPLSRSLSRVVTSASNDSLAIQYQEVTTPINFTIDNVTITQSVQRSDNTVSLVKGRSALLRAFVRSDRQTPITPTVRARIYDGGTLLTTVNLTPPDSGVPLLALDGVLASTYNSVISGELIRMQLRVAVEVDPDSTSGDTQRNDNLWPGGQPKSIAVVSVPPLSVRFVPVAINDAVGDVTMTNRERFLTLAKVMWPLSEVTSDVRAAFVSSVNELDPTDSNGGWNVLLSELRALQVLDGAPPATHYYGVVKTPYAKGLFGLGLVGAPVAAGWDRSDADTVMAHELGHNFGRFHAPCGNAPAADPSYPLIGGAIGTAGWNSSTGMLEPATRADIMSYCRPAWISEYNYTRAMAFRQANAPAAGAARIAVSTSERASANGLMIWGRIARGRIEVEPAFLVSTSRYYQQSNQVAIKPATHAIELLDSKGIVIESRTIAIDRTDHSASGTAQDGSFVELVPFNSTLSRRLGAIRVRDLKSPQDYAVRAADTAAIMGVLIDPATGLARGFVRSGFSTKESHSGLAVAWSNGITTVAGQIAK